ncbi:NUDIX domain-containing protein [Paenibacillus sp. sgz500958]|uniref:NUDIX hydrolase n=1 Tax=Paenibacillus sp. sgz500958 TaxID=3242475 RepID=UPI0036D3A044
MATRIDKVAWIHIVDGRILSARSKGQETYYLPGGKREPGESDVETLVREIEEELSVAIRPETASLFGVFEAGAHGKTEDIKVQMTCFTADFTGELRPASEIEEMAWLGYVDRDRVSEVSRIIFDRLHELKLLK